MTKRENINFRIEVLVFLLLAFFFSLGIRMYYLQVLRHKELFQKAREYYTGTKVEKGKRGRVFDRQGNLLVGNIPCSNIIADPQIVGDEVQCRKLATFFQNQLDLDYDNIYRRLMKKNRIRENDDGTLTELPNRYAFIAREIDHKKSEKIKKLLRKNSLNKGVFFKETYRRYYPKGRLLSNILGFSNIDRGRTKPVMGILKTMDKNLSSHQKTIKYERSRRGFILSYEYLDENTKKNEDGSDIYLTVIEPIQAILEDELDKLMEKWKPKVAYAVMIEPENGEIMAIAQRPTFNPNDRSSITPEIYRNRLAADVFEPGSAMKPIAVSGALDYGVVKPSTVVDCEKGIWWYAGKPLRDAGHSFGKMNVTEIIEKSSNIGTAKISLAMGEKRLFRTLRNFGFGQRTGIPMRPESRGIFRSLEKWDKLSITRFPMGQGIAVTPLQLARAYCAFANGGKLVNLSLIDRIKSGNSLILNKKEKEKRVFKRHRTVKEIVNMLKLVTGENGTAKKAAVPGYAVAGKTGTSQKWDNENKCYSHEKYISTFIGFVPADNPEFVLLIVADEPKGSHYGGTVAAPAFKNISERTLKYLNVKPRRYISRKTE